MGHALIITWALSIGEVDEIWITPCFQHAFSKVLSGYEHRMEMCRQLTAPFDSERVKVSSIESELGGPNRTITTLLALKQQNPDTDFRLLIGADVLHERDKWQQFDDLIALFPPIVVGRDGYPPPEGFAVSPPLVEISSTEVRDSIRAKKSVWQWVPHEIIEYIRTHRLYL